MGETSIALVVFVVVIVGCNYLWKRTAITTSFRWCSEHGITPDVESFQFRMGRPAHMEFVGTENDQGYSYVLRLHSGFLSLPSSFFDVWGRVDLDSKAAI